MGACRRRLRWSTTRARAPNTARQQKPHAHGIYLDAAERFAFAPDLGADRVFVYRFDAEKGTLTPHGAAPVEPGSGPRHLAFHPKGRHAYVIGELSNTITVFGYDPAKGELASIESVKTLPEGFTGTSYTAEVEASPDGRFLYGSNRGHDSLVAFRIDPASGRLALAGHVPVGGAWPRTSRSRPTAACCSPPTSAPERSPCSASTRRAGCRSPSGRVSRSTGRRACCR